MMGFLKNIHPEYVNSPSSPTSPATAVPGEEPIDENLIDNLLDSPIETQQFLLHDKSQRNTEATPKIKTYKITSLKNKLLATAKQQPLVICFLNCQNTQTKVRNYSLDSDQRTWWALGLPS